MKSRLRAHPRRDLNVSSSFPELLSVYAASPAPSSAPLTLLHQLTTLRDILRFFASHLLKMLEGIHLRLLNPFPVETGNNFFAALPVKDPPSPSTCRKVPYIAFLRQSTTS